jgi:hypothetical protein
MEALPVKVVVYAVFFTLQYCEIASGNEQHNDLEARRCMKLKATGS